MFGLILTTPAQFPTGLQKPLLSSFLRQAGMDSLPPDNTQGHVTEADAATSRTNRSWSISLTTTTRSRSTSHSEFPSDHGCLSCKANHVYSMLSLCKPPFIDPAAMDCRVETATKRCKDCRGKQSRQRREATVSRLL